MQYVYRPTGQKIIFRGLDKAKKTKSIKTSRGYFKYLWLEELDEFSGIEEIRTVQQSVLRGGSKLWYSRPSIHLSAVVTGQMYMSMSRERTVTGTRAIIQAFQADWLGDQFIADAEHLKATNERAYRHEYLGEPVGLGTNIFDMLEIRMITDEEIQTYQSIYQGQDFGWYPDPKAFIRAAYVPNKERIVLLDELGGCKIRNADMAQMIKDKGYDDYALLCGVDEQESIVDLRDAGIPARNAIVTPGSRKYTFEWLQCGRLLLTQPERRGHIKKSQNTNTK